jgi:hypothetical protein
MNARIADISGEEITVWFYGKHAEDIFGFPATRFHEMKQRADYYGRGDIALNMLTELYSSILYRTVVLDCIAKHGYWCPLTLNKSPLNIKAEGIAKGRQIPWKGINKSLINRLMAYSERDRLE